jgi:hypothetical protein
MTVTAPNLIPELSDTLHRRRVSRDRPPHGPRHRPHQPSDRRPSELRDHTLADPGVPASWKGVAGSRSAASSHSSTRDKRCALPHGPHDSALPPGRRPSHSSSSPIGRSCASVTQRGGRLWGWLSAPSWVTRVRSAGERRRCARGGRRARCAVASPAMPQRGVVRGMCSAGCLPPSSEVASTFVTPDGGYARFFELGREFR